MNIILFGPPGSGKSTVIGILKSSGKRAIDLEDIYPARIRFRIPNEIDNTIIGGADLNPHRTYAHSIKVVLMPESQEVYDLQRMKRDDEIPNKRNQVKQFLKDWEGIKDAILLKEVFGKPTDTAERISFLYDDLISGRRPNHETK